MLASRHKIQGFTLMELMIVVAIIGILAGIGLPQYNKQVVSAKRSDGVQMLARVMASQERYFANEITYTTDLTNIGLASAAAVSSTEDYYKVTATACGGGIGQCVLLTAVAQGPQAADGDLTLNSRGAKTGNWP